MEVMHTNSASLFVLLDKSIDLTYLESLVRVRVPASDGVLSLHINGVRLSDAPGGLERCIVLSTRDGKWLVLYSSPGGVQSGALLREAGA